MFRQICNNLLKICSLQHQPVRGIRKPRKPFWLGTAKSKIFRIHEQPVLPPEEVEELKRLHANYKTSMKSIRNYFESGETKEIDAMEARSHQASQEEIEESLRENDKWNAECARIRAERLAKSAKEHEDMVTNILDLVDTKQKATQERIEELVRIEKERSSDFITRENLDKKIEECLGTEVDHNYAIDLEGNMYTGFQEQMTARPLDINRKQANKETIS